MKRSFVTWNAFSLVELLVVIAIIGLLAALILMGVSRVEKRTQVTVDLSNQKQILTAMLMYVSDNQDSLPNPGYGRSNPCWAYAANLPSGPVGGAGPAFDAILRAQQDSFAKGQLAPHLRACSLLKCPGDTPASDPRYYQRKVYISSYVWNAAIIGYADQRPPFKISRFGPNDILEWEQDEKEETFYFNDCANRPDELLSHRHGKIGPVGLFGGSVEQINCKEFEELALAPMANRLWCRPDSPTGR